MHTLITIQLLQAQHTAIHHTPQLILRKVLPVLWPTLPPLVHLLIQIPKRILDHHQQLKLIRAEVILNLGLQLLDRQQVLMANSASPIHRRPDRLEMVLVVGGELLQHVFFAGGDVLEHCEAAGGFFYQPVDVGQGVG